MMFILYSAADVVSLGSWFVFKVLTFNVAMLMFLHPSYLSLGCEDDFLNTDTRAPTSVEYAPCLPVYKVMHFNVQFGLES